MDKGLGDSLNISESEPPSTNKNMSLEQRIYSEKYVELNDFLQNIGPEISTSQSLEKKIRDYLKIGSIAKQGLEKASEIYNEDSEPFEDAFYLLEKGQTPTLLHKYSKNIKKFNKIIVKDMLKNFEDDVKEVAFKYQGLRKRKRKLSHSESLNYILKNCDMEEIKNKNDIIEALMLAQVIGINGLIINRWDRGKVDNKKVGSLTLAFFERYYNGNKIDLYNKIKDKVSEKFGRTMSKSTFYRYVRENKEPIKLTIEPDIPELQSNVG